MDIVRGIFNAIGSVISTAGEFMSSSMENCCANCEYCDIDYKDGYTFYVCNKCGEPYNYTGKKMLCGKRILGFTMRDVLTTHCEGHSFVQANINESTGHKDGLYLQDFAEQEGCEELY